MWLGAAAVGLLPIILTAISLQLINLRCSAKRLNASGPLLFLGIFHNCLCERFLRDGLCLLDSLLKFF